MRRHLVAAVLGAALAALTATALPIAAEAGQSSLSEEVAAKGIAATEVRLAALEDPLPPELFALAGLRFLSSVEHALQLRWQTGTSDVAVVLPVFRLPIDDNPDARPLAGADITALLTGLTTDLEGARTALDRLGSRDFALEIALDDLWFDINANGKRDEGEGVAEVAGIVLGTPSSPGVEVIAPVIRFDTADAAWLSAYTHFIGFFAELALAYDPAAAVDMVMASSRAMMEYRRESPGEDDWDLMFGREVDRIAMVIAALAQQPDAGRTRAARAHLLTMVDENRRFWDLVDVESDNDNEWIPNDRQTSALGLDVPQGLGVRWRAVLGDAEAILKGELLVPHWRYGAGAGIDINRLFEMPPAVDLVAMVQGGAFLPYARRGPLVSSESWDAFARLVQGDALLFAILLN